ncbi:hypothetical protein GQ457_08G019760 [Hibiscus cannabinus]
MPPLYQRKPYNIFTHSHTLKEVSTDSEFLCNGCKTLGFGTWYPCELCDFDLHDQSGTSPMELSSFMHKHGIMLVICKPRATRQIDRVCELDGDLVKVAKDLGKLFKILFLMALLKGFHAQIQLPVSANVAHVQKENTGNYSKAARPQFNGGRSRARGQGRSRLQCQLCGNMGHSVDRCWHRFDQYFSGVLAHSQNESNRSNAHTHVSLVDTNSGCCNSRCTGHGKTSAMQVTYKLGVESDAWVVDSGATHHITSDESKVIHGVDYVGPANNSSQERIQDMSSMNADDTSVCGQGDQLLSPVISRNSPIDTPGLLNSSEAESDEASSSEQQLVGQSSANEESGVDAINQTDTQGDVQTDGIHDDGKSDELQDGVQADVVSQPSHGMVTRSYNNQTGKCMIHARLGIIDVDFSTSTFTSSFF